MKISSSSRSTLTTMMPQYATGMQGSSKTARQGSCLVRSFWRSTACSSRRATPRSSVTTSSARLMRTTMATLTSRSSC
ncbi:hypothetical protein V5799_000249 [Amblyomma americanum]|uniref:Uncharacterized protein n=1 Tax=Amblyomma americanum TaxID=6943 RepID=A0AAQ4D3K9_AMBAM